MLQTAPNAQGADSGREVVRLGKKEFHISNTYLDIQSHFEIGKPKGSQCGCGAHKGGNRRWPLTIKVVAVVG